MFWGSGGGCAAEACVSPALGWREMVWTRRVGRAEGGKVALIGSFAVVAEFLGLGERRGYGRVGRLSKIGRRGAGRSTGFAESLGGRGSAWRV